MKRWNILKHDRESVAKLAAEINVSPIVSALLISRGYDSPEIATKFLKPSFDDLHEPNLLKDLEKASKPSKMARKFSFGAIMMLTEQPELSFYERLWKCSGQQPVFTSPIVLPKVTD
jgi:hypothetical protein